MHAREDHQQPQHAFDLPAQANAVAWWAGGKAAPSTEPASTRVCARTPATAVLVLDCVQPEALTLPAGSHSALAQAAPSHHASATTVQHEDDQPAHVQLVRGSTRLVDLTDSRLPLHLPLDDTHGTFAMLPSF